MEEDEVTKYIKDKISSLKLSGNVQKEIVANVIKDAKIVTRNIDQSKEACNPVALRIMHSLFKEVSQLTRTHFRRV